MNLGLRAFTIALLCLSTWACPGSGDSALDSQRTSPAHQDSTPRAGETRASASRSTAGTKSTGDATNRSASQLPRAATRQAPLIKIARTPGAERVGDAAESSPWRSRQQCLDSLKSRTERVDGPARVASYNVKWFPDGRPGKKALATGGTDLVWLACSIAHLDVDALAVQEFKTSPRARESLRQVLDALDSFTQGSWQAAFDDCPQLFTQHVGVIWNAKRVNGGQARTRGELNPHGEPCKDALRPGLEVTLRWPDRPPLRMTSVHFKSGTQARSFELRTRSFQSLLSAFDWSASVIVAGDFNTMGCSDCAVLADGASERGSRSELLKAKSISLLPPEKGCSLYYKGSPELVDGFAVSSDLEGASVLVSGICDETRCAAGGRVARSDAAHFLSDHCPLILQLPEPRKRGG